MIDPSATIHSSVKIGKNVHIGPSTIIGAGVEINDNTWIGPHVVIAGPTKIGKNNKIFQFASVGDVPQDTTYKGESTYLEIGDDNVIREYCMISRGTKKGGSLTKIGNGNFFMAYSHVGHDCLVGDHTVMVNYSALSGHVILENFVIIGAYAAIHQFCRIGAYAFIARATYITKDVIPYVLISPSTSPCGINTVGLKRRGFSSEAINNLRRAYKIIFRQGLTAQKAVAQLEIMQQSCPEVIPLIDAINQSTRGIIR